MRVLACQLSVLEKPDGSVDFMQGETKIMCGVYGPAEVKMQKEIIDKATVECIVKPKVGMPGVKDKAVEEILNQTCDQALLGYLHPRSSIQVVFQVIHDSGSLLSCLLNGACVAMVHAGLPMKHMFVAVCCVITNDGNYLIDPTDVQEQDARCLFTFSFETKNYNIISSQTVGRFRTEEPEVSFQKLFQLLVIYERGRICYWHLYIKCLKLAQSSAEEVAEFQRLEIGRYMLKEPFVNTESENESNAEQTVDGRDSTVENEVTSLIND